MLQRGNRGALFGEDASEDLDAGGESRETPPSARACAYPMVRVSGADDGTKVDTGPLQLSDAGGVPL